MFKDEQMVREVTWGVLGSDKYGIPGPSAVETDMVITKLINDRGWPVPKWIETTLYELAKIKRISPNGNNIKTLRRDLKELGTTSYESIKTFKCKWEKKGKKYLNATLHKYEAIVLKGENVPLAFEQEIPTNEKGKAEKVYIILSDFYRQSLNSYYTKQIDFEYLMSLEGVVSKRLYELFNFAFATRMENKDFVKYPYLELCSRVPIAAQKYISAAKRNLSRHLDGLITAKYLAKYEWVNNSNQSEDWSIMLYPGSVAKTEEGNKEQLLLPLNIQIDTGQELVKFFLRSFALRREPLEKEINQAQELIQRLGQKKAEQTLNYGVNKIKDNFTNAPDFFGAVLLHEAEALENLTKKENETQLSQKHEQEKENYDSLIRLERAEMEKYTRYLATLEHEKQQEIREQAMESLKKAGNVFGLRSQLSIEMEMVKIMKETGIEPDKELVLVS